MVNVRNFADLPKALDSAAAGTFLYKTANSVEFQTLEYSDIVGYPTTGIDSAGIISLIDSNHISPRVSGGFDVANFVDSGISSNITKDSAGVTVKLGNYSKGIGNLYLDSSSLITIGSHKFNLSGDQVTFFGGNASSYGISSGSSAAVVVENSSYTSFLLKTDSTQTDAQIDASTNALTITESGDVKSTAFTPYHPKGYSLYCPDDGNDIYTNIGTISANTAFTLEFWVKMHDTATETSGLFDWGGHNAAGHLAMFSQGNGNYAVYGTFGTAYSAGYNAIWDNEWHHFCVQRDASGNGQTFIDGTVVETKTGTFTGATGNDGYLKIGGLRNYSGYGNHVSFKDFRVVDGTQVYDASGFTPPTEPLTAIPGTIALLCSDANITDKSTNGWTISKSGAPTTRMETPYDHVAYSPANDGGSVYFDGTGDYLSVPDDEGFELDGDFAIELWFNRSSVVSGTYSSLIGGNGSGSNGWNIYITNSNGAISFFHNSFLLTYTEGVVSNTWYHVAVTRSGTALKLFVNGVERASTTNSTTFIQNNANTGTRIGYDINANGYFNGYISDARVVKGSAVYTADFTPPTEPLTAISGTQLLTCTNKNSIWDAAAGQDITATGDAAASTTQFKWSSSTVFDDAGDYLTATIDPPGTGDYTIECWVRFNSMSAGNQSFLSFGTFSPAIYYRSASNELAVYYSNAFYLSGFTPVADTWYHIAWTRSGTSCRLFVDGVQKGTTASNAHNVTSSSLRIGYDGVDYFGGYIEDVRYTKGVARYTADFTPPTSSLTA